jgi:hypothetical protein
MWNLLHTFGIDDTAGRWYAFWSGAGSDLGELAIIGALAGTYRRHTCEVHRCWRLGRHTTAAGQHVCRRHHPDGHLTAEAVRKAHHLYLGSRPGRG